MSKDLFDYYRVTWLDANGQQRYGLVQHGREAEKDFKRGFLRIADPVLPVDDRVALSVVKKLPMEFGGEFDRHVEAEFNKATKLSDSIKTFGPGKLFSLGVADGSAWYVVTKVTKKTATVEWRGFCPDRYVDQILGYGGTFPRETIEPLCRVTYSGTPWR